jgi:hypothetical protein
MRNISSIYSQYDAGKVGMEMGGKGICFALESIRE